MVFNCSLGNVINTLLVLRLMNGSSLYESSRNAIPYKDVEWFRVLVTESGSMLPIAYAERRQSVPVITTGKGKGWACELLLFLSPDVS